VATSAIRWSILVPGIICLLLGSIWALQGLGLISGSFMSRQLFWTGIGAVVFIIGLVLAYRGIATHPKQA